ncbi:DUF3426 domain-containing protein [Thauera sp. WH-1]|uniref:DUF3426 domain-containing protein n=1 Tax=Thauera sp. WH-1 TaxID=3398230 RepID=UPI0039FBD0E1
MMLTRCPACQTVFRLRPEQLHARRGEVRCGHCFHPFNALEHAIDRPVEAPPATASAAGVARPDHSESPPPTLERATRRTQAADFFVLAEKPQTPPSAGAALDFEIPDFTPPDEPRPAESAKGAAWAERAEEPERREVPASPVPFERTGLTDYNLSYDAEGSAAHAQAAFIPQVMPDVLRSGRRAAAAVPAEPSAVAARESAPETEPPAQPAAQAAPEPAPEPAPDIARLDAAYGRPKQAAHPAVRALASLVLVLMLGLLGTQLGYLYRMEIARELPGLRPLLVAACTPIGCTVPYARDADRIAIDASELQSEPGRPGHYLLQATLNNRADYPQHWPHLELTLTDAGDKPISRRVLAPADWLPDTQSAEAFSARSAVGVRIPFEAPGIAPTGYRIYLFYP